MSAPIVVSAAAGATPLLFESSICIALLTVVPVGMWAKVSISPPSELAREAGEAQPVPGGHGMSLEPLVFTSGPANDKGIDRAELLLKLRGVESAEVAHPTRQDRVNPGGDLRQIKVASTVARQS